MAVYDPEVLAALAAIDSPTVANAIEAFDVRDRTAGYVGVRTRCLFPEMGVMAGYAVTATVDTTTPGGPKGYEGAIRLYERLAAAPRPAVVVLQAVGPNLLTSCVVGGIMATLMRRLGAVGLLTNGGARDLADMRQLGFRCFAAGTVVSHGTIGILDIDVPVEIDGLAIAPGDLLHGDENGLVLVPTQIDGAALVTECARVHTAERARIVSVTAPDFRPEQLRR
ncbi:MAG: RraA family protein [Chloroflexi bacterium]|nr:RraA family protein [Chloroflexota bacterium]